MNEDADPTVDLAGEAYSAAKRLTKEGRFAEALERHEWFHHHALEHHPAYYWVRLSFALSAWKELGEKYPPALESLKRIRDENTASLRGGAGSDELFHDVVAINRTLDEDNASMALFREIQASDRDAARCRFRYLKETALERDPDLFLSFTQDLVVYMVEQRRFHLDFMASRQRLEQSQIEPRMVEAIRRSTQALEDKFVALCRRLIERAVSAGRPQQASDMEQLVQQWKQADEGVVV